MKINAVFANPIIQTKADGKHGGVIQWIDEQQGKDMLKKMGIDEKEPHTIYR